MTVRRITPKAIAQTLLALLSTALLAAGAEGPSSAAASDCASVGGTFMTNLGVIDGSGVGSTTLGRVTGDFSGAVAATIKAMSGGAGGTEVFTVHHHLVTDAGDFIFADDAKATVLPVPATSLLAIVTYPVHVTGGTGKFAHATGDINNIGEINVPNAPDLTGATLILRYSGHVLV